MMEPTHVTVRPAHEDPVPPNTLAEFRKFGLGKIAAWVFWDWGSAAFNAVMVTFVFGTYLASEAFGPNDRGTSWLSFGTSVAGIVIALTAPIIGQRSDNSAGRQKWLMLNTLLTIAMIALCFFVKPEEAYLFLGVALISLANITFEFASVHYNAILVDIASPNNIGRISGIGWGFGYLGGIVLLLLVYIGLISDGAHWFGVGEDEALNIRVVALMAATWFLVFAGPLLFGKAFKQPDTARTSNGSRPTIVESYKQLGRKLAQMRRQDRNTLWFLLTSAVFRDAVQAVFAFGAILGVTVYGISPADVLIFGITANVIAAAGAFSGGWFEDRIGPKPVIMISLVGLALTAIITFFQNGPEAFWVCGLILCFFVGPVQSSSRAFLGRLTTPENAGSYYGLYATTGRSVSFLTPGLISIAVAIFGDSRMIIPAIIIVLVAGFIMMIFVKDPAKHPELMEMDR